MTVTLPTNQSPIPSHLVLAVLNILAQSTDPLTADACSRRLNPAGVVHPSRILGHARRSGLVELVSGAPNHYRITEGGRMLLKASGPRGTEALPSWLMEGITESLAGLARPVFTEEPDRSQWLTSLKPGDDVLVLWGPPSAASEEDYDWSMVQTIADGLIRLHPRGPSMLVTTGERPMKEPDTLAARIFPPVGERARAARLRYLQTFIQNVKWPAWEKVPGPVLELVASLLGAVR